ALAMSGDTLLVGVPEATLGRGEAHVYVRTGSDWDRQAILGAADGAAFDKFGGAVALEGETAVVGARQCVQGGAGAAYVFARSAGLWSQQAKLTAPDGAAFDCFGNSVAISGETIAVGAINHVNDVSQRQGAVYVYVRDGA